MLVKLIEARKRLGKTQQQVADEVGISRAYYTNIENEDRAPSLDVALRIAQSVGCPNDMGIFVPVCVSERHNDESVADVRATPKLP